MNNQSLLWDWDYKHMNGATESEEVLGVSYSKDRVVTLIKRLFRTR